MMDSIDNSAASRAPPPFDLKAYISRYETQSETALQRLLFLAHHFHNEEGGDGNNTSTITSNAFEMAVAQMKSTGNYRRYLEEYGAIEASPDNASTTNAADHPSPELTGSPSRSGGGGDHHHPHAKNIIQHYIEYDPNFAPISKIEAQNQLEILEGRLSTAQSHIMKESIRTALLALAEFHKKRGELREALRRVFRSREYCANGRQHTQVCLLLVELSADLREWSSARDSITRAEHTVMGDMDDPLFHHKLRAMQGLAYLSEGRYYDAAKSFTSVSPDLTNQVNSVISAEDIAMYGSLLGLATLDREMLHSLVIDGTFKVRLELVPDMREALRHYSRAEYGQCLSILQHTLKRDLLVDIHLHSHVPILLDMVRDKCIEQYFQPYSSASLEKMGSVFGCTLEEMEMIVVKLIGNGSLGEGARVNVADLTLRVESGDNLEKKTRRRARVAAAKMGAHFTRSAEGMIMRAACIESGVTIQGEKQRRGGRPRGGRPQMHDDDPEMVVDDDPEMEKGVDPIEMDGSDSDGDVMEIENPNEF